MNPGIAAPVRVRLTRLAVLAALIAAAGAALAPAPARAEPLPPVDLLALLTAPDEAAPGGTALYWINMTSNTRVVPTNPRLVLTLPAGVTYRSTDPGDSGPCTANPAGSVVTCTVDRPADIPEGRHLQRITAAVDADVPEGTVLTATLTVESDNPELVPADNTKSDSFTAYLPSDLKLTVIPPGRPVVPGQPVRYTIVARNQGPGTIGHFAVAEGFEGWYIGGDVTTGGADCFTDPGRLVCDLDGPLAPGAELRLEHVLPTRATDDLWGLRTTVGVQTYGPINDTNPANNTLSFSFRFAAKPGGSPSPSASASPSVSASPSPSQSSGSGGTGRNRSVPGALRTTNTSSGRRPPRRTATSL